MQYSIVITFPAINSYFYKSLKKIAAILLLAYYSFGAVCLPMGDFSRIGNLPDMYKHCQMENPGLNPVDFVFEHLLNLGSVVESFEHNNKHDEKELPHQPYHFHLNSFQSIVNVTKPLGINANTEEPLTTIFIFHNEVFFPSDFSGNILRPPIV